MSGSNGNGKNKPPLRLPLFETDPSIRARILESVRLGMSDKQACLEAGISPETLKQWKRRSGQAYRAFVHELQRASLGGLRRNLQSLDQDEPDAVRVKAASWLIARLYPERFSEKRILDITKRTAPNKRREAIRDPEVRAALERAASRLGALREPGKSS